MLAQASSSVLSCEPHRSCTVDIADPVRKPWPDMSVAASVVLVRAWSPSFSSRPCSAYAALPMAPSLSWSTLRSALPPPPPPGSGASWLSLVLTVLVDVDRTDAHSCSNDMFSPATVFVPASPQQVPCPRNQGDRSLAHT